MPAAETRAAHEERRLGHRPTRRREQLDPDVQSPLTRAGIAERAVIVERRQPVDAVDRTSGQPAGQPALELLDRRLALDCQDLDAALRECGGERLRDATRVGHQHDARAAFKRGAGRDAVLERRTEHRHRDPAREAPGVGLGDGGVGLRLSVLRLRRGLRRRSRRLARERTRRHGSASDSRATSTPRHARSHTPHGSPRSPPPA